MEKFFESGWICGMAQGQALSALSRAYRIDKKDSFLNICEKIYRRMVLPIEEGGTGGNCGFIAPTFKELPSIEEYIVKPRSYKLNGWIFSIIGLYDFWQMLPEGNLEREVFNSFRENIVAMATLLPFYDNDGLSSYDLGHITRGSAFNLNLGYHETHVRQLIVLHEITGWEVFKKWSAHWQKPFRFISS